MASVGTTQKQLLASGDPKLLGDRSKILQNKAGTVVFFMPRCRHDHIRAVHKQAWTLHSNGYEVLLAVKQLETDEYLGMRVVETNSSFRSILRPLLNLPQWYLQCRRIGADVFVLRNPDTIPLALMLILTGRRVIYDTHEDFSKRPMIRQISPAFLKPVVASVITAFERLLARVSTAVIVTQAQQVDSLGGRTYLQPNAPLIEGPIMEAARVARPQKDRERSTLIYVGAITENRGLWQMLDLVQQLNHTTSCRLNLVGWFDSDELRRKAQVHSGWQFVEFVGIVSHAESLRRIQNSDVALALLAPVADYPTSSITKLFEYMQSGVPFVASDFPAWRLPEECGVPGLYVDPESPQASLAACLRLLSDAKLRSDMGNVGARYIESEFNWSHYAELFLDIVATARDISRANG